MGCSFPKGLKRKMHPTIRLKSGMHFPRGLSWTIKRRQRLLVYSPSRAFSGVMGSERT